MSNNNVSKKYLEELDIELMIIEFPENELEDILASLARDRGLISKNFYEDFVIANCVANINQLLFTMSKMDYSDLNVKLSDLRRKIYNNVVEINYKLDPNRIYVNHNGVLKIAEDGKELGEDEFWLVKNKMWDINNYEELLDKEGGFEIPVSDYVGSNDNQENNNKNKEEEVNKTKPNKSLDELDYDTVEKWWRRLGQYIKIRRYKEEDGPVILSSAEFDTRTSFNAYIVSICIEDIDDIYAYLDQLGTPKQIQPPILMHELYDLCRQINPFLTFDKVPEENKITASKKDKQAAKKKANLSMSDYAKESKQKNKFKDIDKKELLELDSNMKKQLIGQDQAIKDIVESVQRASVGLKDPNKPIGSFLFAGPTGCGKTLTSKVLAENLVKDKEGLIIIDCSEYSAEHEYSKLIGAPAGYIGHEQGGYLTNAVSQNPFSVVVFDEVEKASHKIHELLLQVLDEGRLSDGKGTPVSFKDTIIVMTSNIGVKEIESIKNTIGFGDVSKVTDEKKDTTIDKALKKKFRPEFINRIDSIVYFKKLTEDNYMEIIDLELDKLNDYLEQNDTEFKNVDLTFDSKIKKLIYNKGIDEQYGARPLKRCIERNISTPLALRMLREDINKNSDIRVSAKKGEPIFDIKQTVSNDDQEEKTYVNGNK